VFGAATRGREDGRMVFGERFHDGASFAVQVSESFFDAG